KRVTPNGFSPSGTTVWGFQSNTTEVSSACSNGFTETNTPALASVWRYVNAWLKSREGEFGWSQSLGAALHFSLASPEWRSMDPKQVRIFVIEDNLGDVLLIQEALNARGIEAQLQVSTDGEQALRNLSSVDPRTAPDLMIIDLNLPRISGMAL